MVLKRKSKNVDSRLKISGMTRGEVDSPLNFGNDGRIVCSTPFLSLRGSLIRLPRQSRFFEPKQTLKGKLHRVKYSGSPRSASGLPRDDRLRQRAEG